MMLLLTAMQKVFDSMTTSKNLYLHTRVSEATAAKLKAIAKQQDRSVSYIMRQAITEYLAIDDLCLTAD